MSRRRESAESTAAEADADVEIMEAEIAPTPKRGRMALKSHKSIGAGSDDASAPAKKKGGARAEDTVTDIDESPTALPAAAPHDVVITSFNVNGLRGAIKNGLMPLLKAMSPQPDAVVVQEIKGTEAQFDGFREGMANLGYSVHYNSGITAGYAGTMLLCRKAGPLAKPLAVSATQSLARAFDPSALAVPAAAALSGVDAAAAAADCVVPHFSADARALSGEMDAEVWALNAAEGRVLTAEYPTFYLASAYVPNAGQKLERLGFRSKVWEPVMAEYLLRLQEKKPVVWCGDLNVAHRPIDIHNPVTNHKTHGFTDEEREQFTTLLSAGFTDAFRATWGPKRRGYTFWGHRFGGREKNAGWRLDYFLLSHALAAAVRGVAVGDERVKDGRVSDHAPLTIVLDGAKLGAAATEGAVTEPAEAAASADDVQASG